MKAAPRVLAYGVGVDSTALLIELHSRGECPDLVITADPGAEKPMTYAYLAMMRQWMADREIPFELVRYEPKRFKNYPPYSTIAENCLTNATLPSASFGGKSCSIKWKQQPQDKFLRTWPPAIDAWAAGQRVVKFIGYDASSRDNVRSAHAITIDDPRYAAQYPLQEWGWTRDICARRIERAGLPVPPKSSCIMRVAKKPDEVRELPLESLRLIVLMEARAAPRLTTVEGLWRKSTRKRPGRMTDFIRAERLLDADEIDQIVTAAPLDLVAFNDAAALIPIAARPALRDWLARYQQAFIHPDPLQHQTPVAA